MISLVEDCCHPLKKTTTTKSTETAIHRNRILTTCLYLREKSPWLDCSLQWILHSEQDLPIQLHWSSWFLMLDHQDWHYHVASCFPSSIWCEFLIYPLYLSHQGDLNNTKHKQIRGRKKIQKIRIIFVLFPSICIKQDVILIIKIFKVILH